MSISLHVPIANVKETRENGSRPTSQTRGQQMEQFSALRVGLCGVENSERWRGEMMNAWAGDDHFIGSMSRDEIVKGSLFSLCQYSAFMLISNVLNHGIDPVIFSDPEYRWPNFPALSLQVMQYPPMTFRS
jgi:hypothetical protein